MIATQTQPDFNNPFARVLTSVLESVPAHATTPGKLDLKTKLDIETQNIRLLYFAQDGNDEVVSLDTNKHIHLIYEKGHFDVIYTLLGSHGNPSHQNIHQQIYIDFVGRIPIPQTKIITQETTAYRGIVAQTFIGPIKIKINAKANSFLLVLE